MYRKLVEAWKRVKAKDGAGGIDQISIEDIEKYGVEKFLKETEEKLRAGKYHPMPVRRVYINKGAGKKRPLGIPVIRDRVVQMATKIAIEPVFEADFQESSYGFRPKRSMHQALDRIRKDTKNNGWWVVDAREYINSEIGSPQGGVISPLLANIYLNYLDTKWELHYQHLGKLIRFADDFVVISRTKKQAQHALKAVKAIMERLELQMNPEKTKLVNIWDGKEGFDFLGFHHRFKKSETAKGRIFKETHQVPSKKAMSKMRENIRKVFTRGTLPLDIKEMIKIQNPKIVGMRNYYGLKNAGKQLNKIDWYIVKKFTVWYNCKRKVRRHYAGIAKIRKIIYEHGLQKLAG